MDMSESAALQPLVVAESCRIDQTGGGTVLLRLGELTLRLPPRDFLSVAAAVQLAASRVRGPAPGGVCATRLLSHRVQGSVPSQDGSSNQVSRKVSRTPMASRLRR